MAAKYPHLLPPNFTPLERALAESTGRLDNELPVYIDDLLNVREIPEQFLPWLAWHLSLDLWDWEWSESKRREVISKAILLAQKKGTPFGMELGQEIMDYEVKEWVRPPGGFYASPNLTQDEWDAWIRQMPQIRVKFESRIGDAGYDEFYAEPKETITQYDGSPVPEDGWDPGYELGADGIASPGLQGSPDDGGVGGNYAGFDNGPALYGRQAVIRYADGTEKDLLLSEKVDTTTTRAAALIGTSSTPGEADEYTAFWAEPEEVNITAGQQQTSGATDVGFCGDDAFVCWEPVKPEIISYKIDTSYEHTSSELQLDYLDTGMEPIDIRYERGSDVETAGPYTFANDVFATSYTALDDQLRLLDNFPLATAAYSTRRLNKNHTGGAVRLRRGTDDVEQDIGFDVSGNLDTESTVEFLGSAIGYVTTWYDQSGNGLDLVQATKSLQPQYSPSGPFGKPTISFASAELSVPADRSELYGGADVSITTVCTPNGSGDSGTLFGWLDGSSPGYVLRLRPDYLGLFTVFDNGADDYPSTTQTVSENPSGWTGADHVLQAYRDGQNRQGVIGDGEIIEEEFTGLTDATGDVSGGGTLVVGNVPLESPDDPYAGDVSELIFWPNDRGKINRDQVYAQLDAYWTTDPLPPDEDDAFADDEDAGRENRGPTAAEMLADYIYLLDPNVVAPMLKGISFADIDRVHVPAYNAWVMVDLKMKQKLPEFFCGNNYANDVESLSGIEDLRDVNRSLDAIIATMSWRDRIGVAWDVVHPMTFGDLDRYSDEETQFGDHFRTLL